MGRHGGGRVQREAARRHAQGRRADAFRWIAEEKAKLIVFKKYMTLMKKGFLLFGRPTVGILTA